MRGSPLLRTFLVLIGLTFTAFGLVRLTEPEEAAPMDPAPTSVPEVGEVRSSSYELILSAAASSIVLKSGDAEIKAVDTTDSLSGTIEVTPTEPWVELSIKWADESSGHRFAKLRIETPGKETQEHVFTARGDIDDIWELTP